MDSIRHWVAGLLYEFANVEEDRHVRRWLRRTASRIVPGPGNQQ